MAYGGVRGWILWVGVAVMTADSLIQLLFVGKIIIDAIIGLIRKLGSHRSGATLSRESGEHYDTNELKEQQLSKHTIPWWWTLIGLIISTVLLTLIGHFVFDLKYYFVWAAIPVGALLSIIAARCSGETDINPVGGMGKVTQLIFAGLAPNQIATNLLSAGIVAAGASQCG